MQICRFAVPSHTYLITAQSLGFVMQGLCYIPQEMYQEFHSFFSIFGAKSGVLYAGGVVGDGADDAAVAFAVAGQFNTAGGGRRIFCVDEAVGKGVRLYKGLREWGKVYWNGALNLPAVVSRYLSAQLETEGMVTSLPRMLST